MYYISIREGDGVPPHPSGMVNRMDDESKVLKQIIGEFMESGGSTIPLLQAIQERLGYIPEEAFQMIEDIIGTPSSTTYGVATFYAQFRLDPVGKHTIKVCDGTACHVKGSETISNSMKEYLELGEGDTTADGLFTLQEVACLGCCSLAPVMMIDDTTYGQLTIEKMRRVIDSYREGEKDE